MKPYRIVVDFIGFARWYNDTKYETFEEAKDKLISITHKRATRDDVVDSKINEDYLSSWVSVTVPVFDKPEKIFYYIVGGEENYELPRI